MRGMHHREPGATGAILTCDAIYAQVIVDLIHVHPAMVKLLVRAKGLERTVLVTEEDEVARELVDYHLGKADWEVVCAEDGEEAARLLIERQFDAAVLDVNTRGRNAIELLRMIRWEDKSKHTVVIVLSSRHREEEEIQSLNEGANDFMTKPFSPQVLLLRLERFMPRV